MLDLHEGVLLAFVETAQTYRKPFYRFAERVPAPPPRPGTIVVPCPRCGARTELREGLRRPVHFGACTAFPELR